MTEHPILFKGAMIKAILDGAKTVTRRVIKPQPEREDTFWRSEDTGKWFGVDETTKTRGPDLRCPYGVPGDRLWVREAFGFTATYNHLSPTEIYEMCQRRGQMIERRDNPGFIHGGSLVLHYRADGLCPDYLNRWRPSIHMLRKFSRIVLEVLDVRVERVQEISEADCWAEGVDDTNDIVGSSRLRCYPMPPEWYELPEPEQWQAEWEPHGSERMRNWTCRCNFIEIWDRINAKRGRVKRYAKPEWAYWLWGRDEGDDREAIALDIADPSAIRWRDPDDWECPEWAAFGDEQPNGDGFYEVLWTPGDTEPRRVWLTRDRGTEGEDWAWEGGYGWDVNPWTWAVTFRLVEAEAARRGERRGERD